MVYGQKILCVDDEPAILDAFRRQLRGKFELEVARDSVAALNLVTKNSFAVIVSDMRMPGLDGVEFLKAVKERSPDTVRVMLTGNVDRVTAIRAINEGHIFRFLSKPVSSEELEVVLKEALEQHRLLTSERELLQNTLSGSIKVMADILGMVAPENFGRANKLRTVVRELSEVLGMGGAWDLELAAMLGDIGRVALPDGAKGEVYDAKAAEIGRSLLANIPRLERVAELVGTSHLKALPPDASNHAKMLLIAREVLRLEGEGIGRKEAVGRLLKDARFDQALIAKLIEFYSPRVEKKVERYPIAPAELLVGQMLLEDVYTSDKRLLITAGSQVTEVVLSKLRSYAEMVGIKEPIYVNARIPGV
jgi:CheY-like chemotaxis protein